MKIFVLGGYGKTGLPVIEMLSNSDLITEIVIAGRNLQKAEQTAAQIGLKATAAYADGTDEQELSSLLSGCDIILNIAYNDTVLPAIKASISTGIPYADVSWGDVAEQALQLSSQAEASGITAVVANGISPSISNLMGVYSASHFDEVVQVQLGRADIFNFETGEELTPKQWRNDPAENLVALEGFKPFIGWAFDRIQKNGIRSMIVYEDDSWVEIDPLKNGVEAPTVQDGTFKFYPYVSGDPSFGELSPAISNVAPMDFWLSPFPPKLHNLLRQYSLRVLEKDLDAETAVESFIDTIKLDPQHWLTSDEEFVVPAKVWVTTVGLKNERPALHRCWFTPAMWNVGGYFLTSVALVVAALKIIRGETELPGVFHAETAFEPLPFFKEVASLIPELSGDESLLDESFEWLT